MYWAKEGDFETHENVLSVIYNGAIASGLVYAQDEPTGVLAESYLIKLIGKEVSLATNLYLSCVLTHVIYPKYSRELLATWANKVENEFIALPTTKSGEIDFDYMENYIQSIVNEALFDMGKFIEKQALLDCILTEQEKSAVNKFDEDRVRMAEFKIGDLFDKVELKKNKFNKRKDTSEQKSVDFSIPLANAKHGNNGIMFYGKSNVFDSVEMTIDIVQNGAVATGDVYPQPQKTGVLWDAYLIKAKNRKETENTLFYFSSSILKSIKQKYSYENKATWERVQNEKILLPITSKNEIDYDFMENYIMAQKKLAMKDVVNNAKE